MSFTALELCAGGGGQALGLELAGFDHAAVVEYESAFCETLRFNRPHWKVICSDIRDVDGRQFKGVDLVAAGVPCPPFSIAGKQLGHEDERDMFPAALRIIRECKPRGVMLENVPGLGSTKFAEYRSKLFRELESMGYIPEARILQASDFGVPQLRPRFIIIALQEKDHIHFEWPAASKRTVTVGDAIGDLLSKNGWLGVDGWLKRADGIAPTLVGGSKKHGGPDLGPTRAKAQWRALGVDGMGLADAPPSPDFPADGSPRLTVRMAARIQSFPDSWIFPGKKTVSYRQIGNAFPPLVAKALGKAIIRAFQRGNGVPKASEHRQTVQLRLLDDTIEYKTQNGRKKTKQAIIKGSDSHVPASKSRKSH